MRMLLGYNSLILFDKLERVKKGPRLSVGMVVSYGDRANPGQTAVVITEEIGEWSTG